MKLALALTLVSSLSFAGEPANAPVTTTSGANDLVVLTPKEAHDEAVRVLTCEADLKDCNARGNISPKWLTVGVVAGVLAGVGIGFAIGYATKKGGGP